MIRLFLLGGFRAERAGQPLPDDAWPRRSGRQLVKLLATEPTHRMHREQIQELLWPDLTPEAAANALRKALHFARHALDPNLPPRCESAVLRLRDDTVQFTAGAVWIDIDDFRTRARAALAGGDQAALEAALAAYGAELLPEDRYEDWSDAPRLALAELHLQLLDELAALWARAGDYGAAVDCLRRVLALDSSREDTHREVMRLFALAGQRHQALRQYRICREALHAEIGAEPDAETDALYHAIVAGRIGGEARAGAITRPGRDLGLLPLAGRLTTGPLVGREPALTHVSEALDRSGAGYGEMVLVGGEAGVGKTRLVAEAARRAHERGHVVFWGGCFERVGQLPYGPLVEALDRASASLPAADRHRLAAAYPELAGLIPALGFGSPEVAAAEPVDADRARLFAAVARLLDELRADRPLLLVVDDLHAADPGTMQLIHHLARLAAERHWLIVGTYREEELAVGGDPHHLRAAAARQDLGRHLALERLTPTESDHLIATLFGGTVPELVRDDLYARTLGNPLFLHEVIRAMREDETFTLANGGWSGGGAHGTAAGGAAGSVPRRLRDLIEARIDRLGEEVRRILALVATAGESCSFWVLQDASDLNETALLDVLDRALAAQLLEERGRGYGFRHPLVRATVYDQLSTPRRIRLHIALATAIERQPDSPAGSSEQIEALAHHWVMAGEAGRAVPFLIQAAERAARVCANADAIARLQRALGLLDADFDDPHLGPSPRARLWERLGDLQALSGENAQASSAYQAALRESQPDRETRGRLHRKIARQALIAVDLTSADRSLALAEASLADAAHSPSLALERVRLLLVRAQMHFLGNRFPESLATAEESARLAEAASSPADVDQASELIAITYLVLGQWRRGVEYERRHAGLSNLNQFVQDVADVHLCLAEYYAHRDLDQAVRGAELFLRALAESERIGAPRSLALCHYFLGTESCVRGRFGEAMTHLTTAIELYDRVGSASGGAIALMMRGITQTALGHLDDGRQDLERGLAAAEQAPLRLRSHAMVRLYAGLAQNRLDANDPAGARRYAEAGLSRADEPSTCICYAAIYPVAAVAFALTGDLDRAAVLGDEALARARELDSPVYRCLSHQAIAMVQTLAGEWAAAFAALDEARRLTELYSLPYDRGRTLLLRAFVHMQRRQAPDLVAANALTAEAWPMLLQLGVRATTAEA